MQSVTVAPQPKSPLLLGGAGDPSYVEAKKKMVWGHLNLPPVQQDVETNQAITWFSKKVFFNQKLVVNAEVDILDFKF